MATGTPPAITEDDGSKYSIAELADAYRQWWVPRQRSRTRRYTLALALKPVLEIYADLPAADFGPLCLTAVQQKYLHADYARSTINMCVYMVRAMFSWGVSRELVEPQVLTALQAFRGLSFGEAREPEKVKTVQDSHIEAIREHVGRPVWAMIQLQIHTAMRPGEVCTMRTRDITKDDSSLPAAVRSLCWVYRPGQHKTDRHGIDRLVLIGPKAQGILAPWLLPDEPGKYIFQPAAGAKQPKKVTNPRYTTQSYYMHIASACEKAKIQPWGPNRLRHNAATTLRRLYGIEVARIILGHTKVSMTELYAEIDLERAGKAIGEAG